MFFNASTFPPITQCVLNVREAFIIPYKAHGLKLRGDERKLEPSCKFVSYIVDSVCPLFNW